MLDERPSLIGILGDIGPAVDELVDALRPPPWQADALCIEHPEIQFFPKKGESNQEAKLCCSICLVRVECLGYALAQGIRDGIWGGTSPQERTLFEPPAETTRFRRGTEGGVLELTPTTRRRQALAEREGYSSPLARRKARAEQRAQSSTVSALTNPAARSGDHAV